MQVTQTLSEGLKREFKVVVSAKDIADKLDDRLAELGRTVRLAGFRPGKVPTTILKQRFGQNLMGEILEQAVNDSAAQAMAEQGLQPVMQPKIEVSSFEDGKDLEYTMALELMPEIEPMDFAALELERLTAEVGDDVVDEALEDMRAQTKRSMPIAKPRKSRSGDDLVIDYTGTIDGKPFAGGSGSDHHLELGSSEFVAGFEDQLIGLEAGAEKQITVTFPEDYPNEALAGKPAAFQVTVKGIRERLPVTLDDEFAKSMGMETLAALRDAVRGRLARDYAGVSRSRLKRVLLDKLAEGHDFNVPPGLMEREFEEIWKQREEQRAQGRGDPDEEGKPEDEIRQEYRRIAERRVRLGLLLNEVGRLNNIQVSEEEVNQMIAAEAQRHPGQERQIYDMFRENPERAAALKAPILEEKVVDFIVEMARVSERTVGIEELLRDPDDEADAAAKPGTKRKPAKKRKSAAKKKA